jgi:hypothetical protein
MRPISRVEPAAPVGIFQTYSIAAPRETHWRRATCEEAGCDAHRYGWRTVLDVATDRGHNTAEYIRRMSGRRFTEERTGPTAVTFTFPPGQDCFKAADHRVRLDRQEIYVVRGGDWRGNPTGQRRTHARPEHWVEDFAENQDHLITLRERG